MTDVRATESRRAGTRPAPKLNRRRAYSGGQLVPVPNGLSGAVEPVAAGTNRAAVECPEVDVLAHPGLLTLEEAELAAQRGCLVEVTTRPGHSLANGHVVQVCRQAGAPMVVDSDTHAPSDMANLAFAQTVAAGASMTPDEIALATGAHPERLLARVLARRQQSA